VGRTYADYLTWDDRPPCELIDGVVYVKEPPAPAVSHQGLVVELCRQASTALGGGPARVYVAPLDVRLPNSTQADDQTYIVVQPDVLIVCELEKLDARGLRGAPDWIAEVLSPGTARYDRNVKLPVYERAGVREVWLIHPIEQTLAIYRLEAGQYGPAIMTKLVGQTRIAAVPAVTIDWDEALARTY
jgi:Uma2 family endonuclease